MTFKGESDNGAGKLYLGFMIFMVLGRELLLSCKLAFLKAEARVPVWFPCRSIM